MSGSKMITIIRTVGNIGSIFNMLKKIGIDAIIASDISIIEKADKLILPGVGTYDNGMNNLREQGLIEVLNKKVIKERTPILGICLGMQLLTKSSEEGTLPGLCWIDARTKRFKFNEKNQKLKIPHMGWNTVKLNKESPLFKEMSDPRFYFVHSYHVICNNDNDILTTTYHGYEFASSIQKDNIIGVQFHPEKSHKFGMKLLKNFVDL